MKRTHTCGELNEGFIGKKVLLQGWVNKIRKMGAITFIDLRDRYGITQLVLDDKIKIDEIKNEYVIEIEGIVVKRKTKNDGIFTGGIEIDVKNILIINKSELTPFEIKNDISTQEDTRLKYRYLDLRRPIMQDALITRSKIINVIRNHYIKNNFIEIETPIFAKSTPEGARDFLVPSRLNKNKFYALPQSPQLFKQLFMIAGFDRYFQIVKCFRDEDLRIDRQPEFTQLDLEMSFADQEDVISMVEKMMQDVLKQVRNVDIKLPLMRLQYKTAIEKYGSDKPDLRFGLEIETLNEIFNKTSVPIFESALKENNYIRGIFVNKLLAKKEIELLTETAKQNSIDILLFAKIDANVWSGSIASKLSDLEKKNLVKKFNIKESGILLVVAEEYHRASQCMGAIRNHVAKLTNIVEKNKFSLLWVVDFPLFEWNEDEKRFIAAHHPFTMPNNESLATFDTDKANAKANAYDIVMNGFELGGGSQRITNPEIQKRMFKAIELSDEQIDKNFGWFINAYKYGAPYHAGCAMGIDRICMLLSETENIREVIAFPKNSSGIDPMSNAPDEVSALQLKELGLELKK